MSLPPLVEPAAELSVDEIRRYSRHLIIPDVGVTGQKRLKNAKVLCVGAGGLGSPALMYLAAAGVGTLGIVEFDTVDESQPAAPDHPRPVRHRPAEGRVGPRLGPGDQPVREGEHPRRSRSRRDNVMEIFADYDLIVDGTDNFATRYLVNDAAVLLGKPYVWGSIYRFDGQASVFWSEHGPCYRCLYPEPPPPGMVPSCAEGGVLGVLCASIGSIQVTEAIKLLTGIGEPLVGRLMVYDALEMTYRKIKVRKDPNCAVCGENPTVTELIDYDDFCGTISDEAAEAASGSTITPAELQRLDRRGQADRPDRRARAGRVRDRQDPGLATGPEGRDPVRRRAGVAAAGPADRPVLQDRRPVGRGARGGEGGRIQGRRPRAGRRGVVDPTDRSVAARLLTLTGGNLSDRGRHRRRDRVRGGPRRPGGSGAAVVAALGAAAAPGRDRESGDGPVARTVAGRPSGAARWRRSTPPASGWPSSTTSVRSTGRRRGRRWPGWPAGSARTAPGRRTRRWPTSRRRGRQPGDPEAGVYLTANVGFWLAVAGPAPGEQINPYAEVVARATQAFRAAMRPDGTWPSFLVAGWLGRGLLYHTGWFYESAQIKVMLAERVPDMSAADVAWLSAALRRAGLSKDDFVLAAARKRLAETQRTDGGWPSDDGDAFDVHTTLTAIRGMR